MKKIFLLLCISLLLLNISFSQCNPDAGLDESVCGNTYTFNASLGDAGSTGIWSTNQTGVVFSDINDPAATVIISPIPTLPVEFYWTENNTIIPCSEVDTIQVTFIPVPTATFVATSTCVGDISVVTYTGNAGPSATYNWTFTGGIPATGFGQGPFMLIWTVAGTYTVTLIVVENGCFADGQQNVMVLPAGSPSCCVMPAVNAGPDMTVCGNSANLQAIPSFGLGTWQASGSASFADINDPNTMVTVSTYGVHEFMWIENNGTSCIDTDYVSVTFVELPYAYAGADTTVFGIATYLNATPASGGATGYWECIPQGPLFSPSIYYNDANLCVSCFCCNYFLVWTVSDGVCASSDTIIITFNSPNTTITGSIFNNSIALNTGDAEVELYKNDAGNYSFVTSDIVSGNSYNLNPLSPGDYILKAKVLNQPAYPDAMDTYYNGEYLWENAQILTLSCDGTINADINLVQTTPFTAGNGKVSGTITYDATGDPVVGTTFFIEDTTINHPFLQTSSDISGFYEFDNLPVGNFEILVDIPGIPLISTHLFSVTATDTLFENYDYYVDTVLFKETGVGIYADTTMLISIYTNSELTDEISTYPNPATDYLYIKINKDIPQDFSIELFESNGLIINKINYNQNNSGIFEYPVKDIASGIYYLCIKIGNDLFIKKFLKVDNL